MRNDEVVRAAVPTVFSGVRHARQVVVFVTMGLVSIALPAWFDAPFFPVLVGSVAGGAAFCLTFGESRRS